MVMSAQLCEYDTFLNRVIVWNMNYTTTNMLLKKLKKHGERSTSSPSVVKASRTAGSDNDTCDLGLQRGRWLGEVCRQEKPEPVLDFSVKMYAGDRQKRSFKDARPGF